MRSVLFAALLTIYVNVNYGQNKSEMVQIDTLPIWINTLTHDFGSIEQFNKQTFTFKVLNTSSLPLVIKHVTTSCGCTSTRFTKRPIKANKTGSIKVNFDAKDKGIFNKWAFIYHNFSEKPTKLVIKGTVYQENRK